LGGEFKTRGHISLTVKDPDVTIQCHLNFSLQLAFDQWQVESFNRVGQVAVFRPVTRVAYMQGQGHYA
jgi:hypothetical protein